MRLLEIRTQASPRSSKIFKVRNLCIRASMYILSVRPHCNEDKTIGFDAMWWVRVRSWREISQSREFSIIGMIWPSVIDTVHAGILMDKYRYLYFQTGCPRVCLTLTGCKAMSRYMQTCHVQVPRLNPMRSYVRL